MGRKAKENAETTVLAGVEVETDDTEENTPEVLDSEAIPEMDSPDWEPYVLSWLLPDEQVDGTPKVAGLVRLTKKLRGRILKSLPDVIEPPRENNGGRAVASHFLKIQCHDGTVEEYGGVADACEENTKGAFAVYPTAMASTRAKARAYRDCLGLSMVTAEELKKTETEDVAETKVNEGLINDAQIRLIAVSGKRNNVNLLSAYKHLFGEEVVSFSKISKDKAIAVCKFLNEVQSGKNIKLTPELTGYQDNWK